MTAFLISESSAEFFLIRGLLSEMLKIKQNKLKMPDNSITICLYEACAAEAHEYISKEMVSYGKSII